MTQEEKDLLLRDLCARLPYGVKAQIKATNCIDGIHTLNFVDLNSFIEDRPRDEDWYDIVTSIKPYLRPKPSMTEDELQRYHELCDVDEEVGVGSSIEIIAVHDTPESLDYLNSIHVDYRGLIPKGLALEAPEGMYNI